MKRDAADQSVIIPARGSIVGNVYRDTGTIGITMIEGGEAIAEVWVPMSEIPALIAWLQSVKG